MTHRLDHQIEAAPQVAQLLERFYLVSAKATGLLSFGEVAGSPPGIAGNGCSYR
jgi:hypothetical protein